MKIGDKVICSDGTEYILTKPSDNTYDFGLVDYKGKEVNCVNEYYLEDCLQEGLYFMVGKNKYKKPIGIQQSFN